MRTLVLTSLPAGVGIGMVEVGLPAFSDAMGAAELAGLLLAVWSLGSAAGGLHLRRAAAPPAAAGACTSRSARCSRSACCRWRPRRRSPVMALLVIPAGAFIAPLLATRNELIGWVAPPGARTEAYTWPVTAFVGGIAIGSAISRRDRRGAGLADRVPDRAPRPAASARSSPSRGAAP